jgi:hypothetical protein
VIKPFKEASVFKDFSWLAMGGIFDTLPILNGLNLSMQGRAVILFKAKSKVKTTIMKLGLWLELQKSVSKSFPTLGNFLAAFDDDHFEEKEILSFNSCRFLKNSFRDCFPLSGANYRWY